MTPSREAALSFLKKKCIGDDEEAYSSDRVVTANLSQTDTTDDELALLTCVPEIEHLDLFECQVTNQGMRHLVALKKLKSLQLMDTEVEDAGLSFVGQLTALEELSIPLEQLTDKGLRHLSNLRKLKKLDLRFTEVTPKGFEVLRNFRHLEELNLAMTRMNDAALEHIAGCQELQILDLDGCESVTSAGLKHLVGLERLHMLNVSSTKVNERALPFLESMRSLRILEATSGVSPEQNLPDTFGEALLQANPRIVAFVGSKVFRIIDPEVPLRPIVCGAVTLSAPETWRIQRESPEEPRTSRRLATEDGYDAGAYDPDAGPAEICLEEYPGEERDDTLKSILEGHTSRVDAGVLTLNNNDVKWVKYISYGIELVTAYAWALSDRTVVVSFSCSRKRYALWEGVFDRVLQSIAIDDASPQKRTAP